MMIDPDVKELDAVSVAGGRAGEYLESLPSTDLTKFTGDQWQTLLLVIVGGYTERMAEIEAAECPF